MGGVEFDWQYLWSATPLLLAGLQMTLILAVTCIAISIVIGYAGATVLFFNVPVLKTLVRSYVSFFRNTPLLVQLFFFYFGLPELGIRASAITSGIIVLSIWAGAYQIESIRGAIEGLSKGLLDAAKSLGLRPLHAFVLVVVPLATRTVVPAMMNTAASTTKNSALLTAIGVPELTYIAMDNVASDYRALENFFALFVGYVTLVLAMSSIATLIERRLGRGFKA